MRPHQDETRSSEERQVLPQVHADPGALVALDPESPDTNQLTDPELPFAMKCDWLPGPPPPPPVSLAVARLGRGPVALAAGVVVESLHAANE